MGTNPETVVDMYKSGNCNVTVPSSSSASGLIGASPETVVGDLVLGDLLLLGAGLICSRIGPPL